MKKIVAIVLFSALLFLGLVSCGTEKPDSNVASGDYVRPDKKTFSEIEQTTFDYYYGQMIQRYPSFAAISEVWKRGVDIPSLNLWRPLRGNGQHLKTGFPNTTPVV